jgi:uncharacterized membrane protein YqaE (UPF0057 family)
MVITLDLVILLLTVRLPPVAAVEVNGLVVMDFKVQVVLVS